MSGSQTKHQLEFLKHKQLWFISLIFLFVIVVSWIGVSLFASQNKLSLSKEMKDMARPITPTLDEKLLRSLAQEKYFSDSDLSQFPIYKLYIAKDGDEVQLVEIGEIIDEKGRKKQFVNSEALNQVESGSNSESSTRSGVSEWFSLFAYSSPCGSSGFYLQ